MIFSAPDFYLNEETIRSQKLDRKDVEDTAIAALLQTRLVEKVYTHADLTSTAPSSDPFLSLFRNAFYEPQSAPHGDAEAVCLSELAAWGNWPRDRV